MKPIILSGLITSGLIHKKNRILCYRPLDESGLSWLRRQRFEVEGPVPEAKGSAAVKGIRRYYDLVVVEYEGTGDGDTTVRDRLIVEGFGYVRPGGRLLVVTLLNGLFSPVTPESVTGQLGVVLAGQPLSFIRPAKTVDPNAALVHVVKKGGVYKPRLPVVYAEDAAAFQKACDSLHDQPFIGLDVETTLKEPRILCTVQLATESTVYVMDVLPIKDLKPLKALMENKGVMKIIHNKEFEAKVLGQYGIQIYNVYDTLVESRKRHKKGVDGSHRLGDVCERELNIYLDKFYQMSDWTRRPLTPEQLDYAAADAEVMVRLYRLFVPPPAPETMDLF